MRTVVVGAGPVGMFAALALAQRRDEVVLVDRDAGPESADSWHRRGVMQFGHPHYFRHIVRDVLAEHLPGVLDDVLAAGAVLAAPGSHPELAGLQCRRSVFERVLRLAAESQPRVEVRVGRADRVSIAGGRIDGVVVDGVSVAADRVICATGRTSRFADDVRAPGTDLDCGLAYVSRTYRARQGATWPDFPVLGAFYDGYQAGLFPHDSGFLSVLIIRRSDDSELKALRHSAAFGAAVAEIPNLAPWTDPADWDALGDVKVGGRLTNSYRGQFDVDGHVPVPGLLFVGDAVCTTNPVAGRGVSLGFAQADAVLRLVGEYPDPVDATAALDAWSAANIYPWFADHVAIDAATLRRYAGEPIDIEGPLASNVVVAAAAHDPSLMPVVLRYLGMLSLPASLAEAEPRARELLRSGWRPTYAAGPTRDQLVDIIGASVQSA
ncbi:MAG: FAD-dependent oxidoreductase [Mycobacteriales bacterium]